MTIKAKARLSKGLVSVQVLIQQPMETGLRVDTKTFQLVPAHHINEIVCRWKDQDVFRCNTGRMVSINPYFAFKIEGPEKGDQLQILTIDSKGEKGYADLTI